MSDVDPAAPPPIGRQPSGNSGCVWFIVLTPVVLILGLLIGAILRDDDGTQETSVRLDEGEIGGVPWYVDAVRDVDGESCIFLYEDGEQLTGGCTTEPQDATIADEATVVFGKAPRESTAVRVGLSDGETIEIETVTAGGVGGRFYVAVVEAPGDLDVTGDLEAIED